MKVLRTPEERFENLLGYAFNPNYTQVTSGDGTEIRIHYVDEGPKDAEVVLMLHGEPSWSYLYRTMIPEFVNAGYRAIAPDLVGFGKSDKPSEREDYTYQAHVDWMQNWLDQLDLKGITLVCQDWGGLIGLRLVVENPERFARIVTANTFLPTGEQPANDAFLAWREFSQTTPEFPVGGIIGGATTSDLSAEIVSAYDAPYPSEEYKAGARQFPTLVPISTDNPATEANKKAWEVLKQWEKPWLTAFSDKDPITGGMDKAFQELIPGARDQAHTTIKDGGHFLQEDKGPELAQATINFMKSNPTT